LLNNLNPELKWALAYVTLLIVLLFMAETTLAPVAAALAALIAGSASFALLPGVLKDLGFTQ
jgi:hypothetical protein